MAAGSNQPIADPRLTDQQRRAITARGVSVALSAGAGCGKTFVLTERFLAQLEPQAGKTAQRPRLGQLVAITFTERAAREMRERIRAACNKRLMEAPEEYVDYWLELIRELDSARISTIHSFCGSLLRSHAVEAELDPRFRVLDQAQADTLLYELLDGELRNRLAEGDETVIELVVQFGLERLHEMVRILLGRRQEIDWPQWRSETPRGLVSRWANFWRSVTLPAIVQNVAGSSAARTVLDIAWQNPSSNAKMRQRFESLVQQLPRLPESSDPAADLASIRGEATVQGGGGKKAWVSEEVYSTFRDAAAALRKEIDRAQKHLTFTADAALPAAESALRLLRVAADVAELYDGEKRQLGAVDFNDLLIRARQLLVGPRQRDVRKRLAAQIRLLLVDEFQDTDPLQVELVEALCDDKLTGGKLFFVGDFKQSIYRFRGARPHVFRRLRDSIPEAGRLPLSLNFRSQPAVLDFVNALFAEEMGPEYEPLEAHRPQISPTPAIEMLWATDQPGDDNDLPAENMGQAERLRRREADWIARRIRQMLDSGEKIVWDETAAKAGKPATRTVRPGDVALLFRALSNVEYYEDALRRYDIGYYLVGGHAFYAQQEIFDVVNLLRALESPCDEVSLLGVLRSPFFGLLDETLYWLSRHPGGLSAGLLAEKPPSRLDAEQRQRLQFAAVTLRELRAMKDRVPIAQLINEALERTGYDAILLAEFLGQRKLANLQKLIEQARSFDRSGIFTLADFITQVSQFVARQPDEPLAATHPESTDVVRLMTIHQSKGLEFPVVVVPDLDRRTHGASTSVAFTKELGPIIKDPAAMSGFDLYVLAEREQQQAEMVRLLYVATTRAADYLILSAGLPRLGSAKGPWMELIRRRFTHLWEGDRPGDSPEGSVEVRVTTVEPPLNYKPSSTRARRDLKKLREKACQTSESGRGRAPKYLAAVAPDPAAFRRFSFSSLTGELRAAIHADELGREVDEVVLEEGPEKGPLSGTELGTLVHAVLEVIDFADPGDIHRLVRRHARRQFIDESLPLDEPIEMIGRFLASPRAAKIAAAAQIHDELEFLLAWPPGSKDPDGRYLQGFIDCLYQDAGGKWHLVDYKTNRVFPATLERVAAVYEPQMGVYALAVERILGCEPVELVLHFLRGGLEHRFPWNDAARQRVRELVDEGIGKKAGTLG